MQDGNSQSYFFGEFRPYKDEVEKEVAKIWLNKWKQMILHTYSNFTFVEEYYVNRENIWNSLDLFNTLALKIHLKGPQDFDFSSIGGLSHEN